MIDLRVATLSEVDNIVRICAEARSFQRECGNVQWGDDYPSAEIITQDVNSRRGYVIEKDGIVVGYCVIDTDGDPEYDEASDLWDTRKPYAAVHRLALADTARGKGLSKLIFEQIEHLILSLGINVLKVDTGLRNEPLQRLMNSLAFSNRGEYTFSWGVRLAYEKVLDPTKIVK